MDNDTLLFAAIFIIAITSLCGGIILLVLNRISGASTMFWHRHTIVHHGGANHRAFKDVL